MTDPREADEIVLEAARRVGGLGQSTLVRLASRVRALLHARRIRRALGRGTAIPIGSAPEGVVRVRGRVVVVAPVTAPTGVRCAAYAWHFVEEVACDCGLPRCRHRLTRTRFEIVSGRFAVVDGSGIALVDDEELELRVELDPDAAGGMTLLGGDTVTVVGFARRTDAPDVAALAPAGGYRGGGPCLAFEGQDGARVVIVRESEGDRPV